MTSISTAATGISIAPRAPSMRPAPLAAWRDLAAGPGPLWWRLARFAQRNAMQEAA